MIGPEITWTPDEPPKRKRRPYKERREQRPLIPATKPRCSSPTCKTPGAPAAEGRYVCQTCCQRLEARAAEYRRRAS